MLQEQIPQFAARQCQIDCVRKRPFDRAVMARRHLTAEADMGRDEVSMPQ